MVTTIYAGLLALLYAGLTFYVIHGRFKYRVGLGDGGNAAMAVRIRAHGNFAEYAPFALLLLFLVDYSQASPVVVHVLGLMLLIGRIFHAAGLRENATPGRQAGMVLTLVMMMACAVILIWKFIALRLAGF